MFSQSFVVLLSLLVLVSGQPSNDVRKLNKLGLLSPYHKAPVPPGIKETLPSDCKVEQVMYLSRHGSRYPSYELPIIEGMAQAVVKAKDYITHANLPKELNFLSGYVSSLGENSLVEMGRQQLLKHGKDFRKQYPRFTFDGFVTSGVERVIESANYFGKGYFGPSWDGVSTGFISPIPTDNVTVSYITPSQVCRKWSLDNADRDGAAWEDVYIPPVTQRLNKMIPGLNFTNTDTLGAFWACAYDYAAHGVSPWCNVFSDQEIEQLEYDMDLSLSAGWGPRLPGKMGAVLGSLYVNKLIERFSQKDGKPAYVEFGHDLTISLALTAMGYATDIPPLSTQEMTPNRKFKTSNLTPFAAQLVFEKFTCSKSFNGPQIRLILNESPYPLDKCIKSEKDKDHGSCSFDEFVKANEFSTSIKYGDATWVAECGPVA